MQSLFREDSLEKMLNIIGQLAESILDRNIFTV